MADQGMTIKAVAEGKFLRRKADSKKTYVRGKYDRSEKRYECHDWDDISRSMYLKGDTVVFTEFEF